MQIPEVIKKLSIDLETYSSVPIKYGVYPYAESPDCYVLLIEKSIFLMICQPWAKPMYEFNTQSDKPFPCGCK